MGALPVHHTPIDSTSSWDAGKVVASSKADLRYVHTWVDGKADPNLKGSYKLPHHLKNGGPAILAGVNNAKARAPQMKGVPAGDMTGINAHLNAHQKDAKQGLLQTILFHLQQWFVGVDEEPDEPAELAISMPSIYDAIGYALSVNNQDIEKPYQRLIDCYIDGTSVYAIIGMEGKLYKAPVTVVPGGVTLGELSQVEIDYKPVAQSFKVVQQADGKYRWFAFPAATAVLNKNGYLNSRELYDNFIKHIQSGEAPMPYLTFYHVGDTLVMGQADFVEREEYTLLMSGLFNDDPLSQCLAKSSKWKGTSIGYNCNPDAVQELLINGDIKIPVHTDGILLEVSALAEQDAACIMTAFYSKGVQQMNQATLKKLKELAGDDPAALAQVKELSDKVDQTNQEIVDENLVRQAQGDVSAEPPANSIPEPAAPVVDTPVVSPESPAPQEVLLTDEALQVLASQVREGLVADLAAAQTTFQTKLDEAVTTLTATLTGLQSRLDVLEQTDQQKVSQALVDMPRTVIQVGVQPRLRNAKPVPVSEEEVTSDDQVAPTLEMLHNMQKSK